MKPTTRVDVVAGSEDSKTRKELQGVTAEIEKLDKLLGRGPHKGLFSNKEASDYLQQIKTVQQSMGKLSQEYRVVTREVRLLEQEQQKLLQTGGKISRQQL